MVFFLQWSTNANRFDRRHIWAGLWNESEWWLKNVFLSIYWSFCKWKVKPSALHCVHLRRKCAYWTQNTVLNCQNSISNMYAIANIARGFSHILWQLLWCSLQCLNKQPLCCQLWALLPPSAYWKSAVNHKTAI